MHHTCILSFSICNGVPQKLCIFWRTEGSAYRILQLHQASHTPSSYWLFVLLASSALSLAVMKSLYGFPTFVPSILALWNPEVDPSSFAKSNRPSSTTPGIVSGSSNSTTEKTDRYSDQAIYLYIYLIGPLIVLYIISGVILSIIRCCCIQQRVICRDLSIQKCLCICCCNRLS